MTPLYMGEYHLAMALRILRKHFPGSSISDVYALGRALSDCDGKDFLRERSVFWPRSAFREISTRKASIRSERTRMV